MNSPIRLVIAGDLHHQAQDRGYLLCSQVLKLWGRFADSKKNLAHCFFQVGDLIDGYELPDATKRADLVAAVAALNASPRPVHAIVGNHETYWLPDRAFHLQALGLPSISRVVEAGPLRIVLFDVTVDNESYGELTSERAAWLADTLSVSPDKPVIVLQHQLIHATDEICEHRHYVKNSGEYRRLLEKYQQVRMIVTGHRHIPTLTMIGVVPQVTLGAFCSFPFTFAEIVADKRQAVFRELPLETTFETADLTEFQRLLALSHEGIIKQNREVWEGRGRMTAELREIVIKW